LIEVCFRNDVRNSVSGLRAAAQKPGFGSTMTRILGELEFKRLIRRVGWRGSIRA